MFLFILFLFLDDANAINLKLLPVYNEPEPVRDWQVPVAIVNFDSIVEKHWDMTLRRVMFEKFAFF